MKDPPEERADEASYKRSTRLGKKEGAFGLEAEGSHFRRRLVASGNGGTIVEVKRQQQDERRMTNSPGWVQNRGLYRAAGGQAAAGRPKLRVERRPFLAPEAVIFGVDFTGPHILCVICGYLIGVTI